MSFSYAGRPSDDISSLLRLDDGLGERIQRDVTGEKLFEHGTEDEHPRAFKSVFIEENGDLEAAGERDRAGGLDAAHDRGDLRMAHTFDLFFEKGVRRIGV